MWWFLVLLGVLIALAGLAVIALGISIFVSTFGNTLITTGAVAASGGLVITAMGLVLRQLERLSQRLDENLTRRAPAGGEETAGEEAPFAEPRAAEARHAPMPFPTAPRGAPEAEAPHLSVEDLIAPEAPATPEEEPAAEAPAEPTLPPRRKMPPLMPERAPALDPMVEARRKRLERELGGELPPPAREAPRPLTGYEPPRHARPAEPQISEPHPGGLEPPAPPAAEGTHPEEPRILKSGIVGGMAYTLYSDGSIQAELPDGVVRFASLQELRDHVAKAQHGR